MRSHDVGLDSLAKAMGESIDKGIVNNIGSLMNNSIGYPVTTHTATASNTSYTPKKYPIQGEMLVVKQVITMEMWEQIPPEVIKKDMMSKLVEELMKSKHIEFTMTKDTLSHDMVRIAARIFVTPDSQVRLLRENGVK